MSFSLRYAGISVGQAEPEQAFERRTYRRFELVSPVLFRSTNSARFYDIGFCTNLGLGGVFIVTTDCPATGTRLLVEVLIKGFESGPGQLRLKCAGEVVRIQTVADQLS